jgi:hypothetical protein
MKEFNKYFVAVLFIVTGSSFQPALSLKGTWQFVGGIYNGKKEGAPTEYALQRKYTPGHYEAFALEKGYKTQKY